MPQAIFHNLIHDLPSIVGERGIRKYLLVHDNALTNLSAVNKVFDGIAIERLNFCGFSSNPLYDEVCNGVSLYNSASCDAIVAIGGGSTIDVAKCIKLFCKMEARENYLKQKFEDSGIPIFAIPTTAGTGSESTRYAVIYYEGRKQSITHDSIIPNVVVLDASLLRSLPSYQKKCTMLDALCQGIESWWSVNSTNESKGYSRTVVKLIMENMDAYLTNPDDLRAASQIMTASNYAGRAINITQTTGPHAMSYKLTSLYKIPHGHAVAVCLPKVWRYMLNNEDKVTDSRGKEYLRAVFQDIAACLGCLSPSEAVKCFERLLDKLGINPPLGDSVDLKVLAASVNPVRLKNNPVPIDEEASYRLYRQIVTEEE